jgi:hypothetical protein
MCQLFHQSECTWARQLSVITATCMHWNITINKAKCVSPSGQWIDKWEITWLLYEWLTVTTAFGSFIMPAFTPPVWNLPLAFCGLFCVTVNIRAILLAVFMISQILQVPWRNRTCLHCSLLWRPCSCYEKHALIPEMRKIKKIMHVRIFIFPNCTEIWTRQNGLHRHMNILRHGQNAC